METEIARLRHRQNLTVAAAARGGNSYIADWYKAERGDKVHPKMRRAIAAVLGVTEDQIFDESGWPLMTEPQAANA